MKEQEWMSDLETDFWIEDRVQKIAQINKDYDLLNKSYISFSGGKDSVVLSKLIDFALPNNAIPRLYLSSGLEFPQMRNFVEELAKRDKRIVILRSPINLKNLFTVYGYPFKSKQHSHNLSIYQRNGMTLTNEKYLGNGEKTQFLCPEILRYQFTPEFKLRVSDKCCTVIKKERAGKWAKENSRPIVMTGIRSSEGGLRNYRDNCTVFQDGVLSAFHPLLPMPDSFIRSVIDSHSLKVCELYNPPYNFKRTGCMGCPFNIKLEEELSVLLRVAPKTAKACYAIWKPVYDEYARIGYRLTAHTVDQLKNALPSEC